MYSHTDVTETLTISQILNLTGLRKALKKFQKVTRVRRSHWVYSQVIDEAVDILQ